jgi:hypothetical protein
MRGQIDNLSSWLARLTQQRNYYIPAARSIELEQYHCLPGAEYQFAVFDRQAH